MLPDPLRWFRGKPSRSTRRPRLGIESLEARELLSTGVTGTLNDQYTSMPVSGEPAPLGPDLLGGLYATQSVHDQPAAAAPVALVYLEAGRLYGVAGGTAVLIAEGVTKAYSLRGTQPPVDLSLPLPVPSETVTYLTSAGRLYTADRDGVREVDLSPGRVSDIAFDARSRLIAIDLDRTLARSRGANGSGGWDTLGTGVVTYAATRAGGWVALQADGQVRRDGEVIATAKRDLYVDGLGRVVVVARDLSRVERSREADGLGGWDTLAVGVAKYALDPAGRVFALQGDGSLSVDGATGWSGTRDFAFGGDGTLYRLGADGRFERLPPGASAGTAAEVLGQTVVKFALAGGDCWTLNAAGELRVNGAVRWSNKADFAFDGRDRLVLLERDGSWLGRSRLAYGAGDWDTVGANVDPSAAVGLAYLSQTGAVGTADVVQWFVGPDGRGQVTSQVVLADGQSYAFNGTTWQQTRAAGAKRLFAGVDAQGRAATITLTASGEVYAAGVGGVVQLGSYPRLAQGTVVQWYAGIDMAGAVGNQVVLADGSAHWYTAGAWQQTDSQRVRGMYAGIDPAGRPATMVLFTTGEVHARNGAARTWLSPELALGKGTVVQWFVGPDVYGRVANWVVLADGQAYTDTGTAWAQSCSSGVKRLFAGADAQGRPATAILMASGEVYATNGTGRSDPLGRCPALAQGVISQWFAGVDMKGQTANQVVLADGQAYWSTGGAWQQTDSRGVRQMFNGVDPDGRPATLVRFDSGEVHIRNGAGRTWLSAFPAFNQGTVVQQFVGPDTYGRVVNWAVLADGQAYVSSGSAWVQACSRGVKQLIAGVGAQGRPATVILMASGEGYATNGVGGNDYLGRCPGVAGGTLAQWFVGPDTRGRVVNQVVLADGQAYEYSGSAWEQTCSRGVKRLFTGAYGPQPATMILMASGEVYATNGAYGSAYLGRCPALAQGVVAQWFVGPDTYGKVVNWAVLADGQAYTFNGSVWAQACSRGVQQLLPGTSLAGRAATLIVLAGGDVYATNGAGGNDSLGKDPPRAWVENGKLVVVGTAAADSIRVAPTGTLNLQMAVYVNGRYLLTTGFGQVSQVQVYAGAGNDFVDLSGVVECGAYVDAGDGDDVVYGTNKNDYLTGGRGSDTLFGCDGDDQLDAGPDGADRLDPVYGYARGNDLYVVPGSGSLVKGYEFRQVYRANGQLVQVREDNPGEDWLEYNNGARDDMDDQDLWAKLGKVTESSLGVIAGVVVTVLTDGAAGIGWLGSAVLSNVASQLVNSVVTGQWFNPASLLGSVAGAGVGQLFESGFTVAGSRTLGSAVQQAAKAGAGGVVSSGVTVVVNGGVFNWGGLAASMAGAATGGATGANPLVESGSTLATRVMDAALKNMAAALAANGVNIAMSGGRIDWVSLLTSSAQGAAGTLVKATLDEIKQLLTTAPSTTTGPDANPRTGSQSRPRAISALIREGMTKPEVFEEVGRDAVLSGLLLGDDSRVRLASADEVKTVIDTATAILGEQGSLEVARVYLSVVGGARACEYFDHFLAGSGTDKQLDLDSLLQNNDTIRAKLLDAVASRPLGQLSGEVVINQREYTSQEDRYAIGGFTFRWTMDESTGEVRVTVDNLYQFHPEQDRPTQAIHQIADDQRLYNGASNFWMRGSITITLPTVLGPFPPILP